MDAWRRIAARTTAAAALLGCCCAQSQELRLPAWVDPSAELVVPAAYEAPPHPLAPQAPALRKSEVASAPRPFEIADAKPLRQESRTALAVRQLEHAASDAKTLHALSRLLARYDALRPALRDPALAKRADRVAAWALVARADQLASDPNAALTDLKRALQIAPDDESARLALALALAERGDAAAALQALDDLLTANPSSVAALTSRATLLLQSGDADAALRDCDAALAQQTAPNADRAATLTLRGVAQHLAGMLRAAGADFDAALAIDPRRPDTLTARGHVYAEAGFYEQAMTDYLAALGGDPRSVEAYRSLAWLLATCPDAALRNPATAVEAAGRARRLAGEDTFLTLDAAAAAHASAGDFPAAVRLQQQAVMALPNSSGAHAAQAKSRLGLYQSQRAYVAQRPATMR